MSVVGGPARQAALFVDGSCRRAWSALWAASASTICPRTALSLQHRSRLGTQVWDADQQLWIRQARGRDTVRG